MHGEHAQPMPHGMRHTDESTAAPEHHAGMEAEFRTRFFVSAALTVPVLMLSPMIQLWLGYRLVVPGQMIILWALATVIALWGAWPFYRGAARALPTGDLNMDVLVSLAVGTAYLFSTAATFLLPSAPEFYWELSTLVVFLLFGHWMEMRSLRGTTGALRALLQLIPPMANRLTDDTIARVPTAELHIGDRLLVRPGEQVPIDGAVLDGASDVNEAMMTGESRPVTKAPGDSVLGGTLNGSGAFSMRVTAVGRDTALAHIVTLIEEAQATKTHTQRLADRAAQVLTLAALIVGAGAFLYWLLIARAGLVFALLSMVSVFIIACPHALGLAIPTVVIIAAALGARAGMLIRNNDATETAVRLTTVVFDKTGTLTRGAFGVTDLLPQPGVSAEELLRMAAAVERNSEHALARGITAAAGDQPLPAAARFQADPGRGAQGEVEGERVAVGNRAYMEHLGIEAAAVQPQVDTRTAEGKTVLYVVRDSHLLGLIALADLVREESPAAVRALQAMGLEVMMLTGDHQNVAAYVARQLGITTYFAEIQPGEKAATVARLQAEGRRVAMVGDGINDAPALVQADIGIAIGAGTQVAIESADIVLVRSDPRDVASLLHLSRATRRKMVQNLIWATGYNVVAIPLAAGVLARYGVVLRPEWAALIMAASTIIVVINALLLRRLRLTVPS